MDLLVNNEEESVILHAIQVDKTTTLSFSNNKLQSLTLTSEILTLNTHSIGCLTRGEHSQNSESILFKKEGKKQKKRWVFA